MSEVERASSDDYDFQAETIDPLAGQDKIEAEMKAEERYSEWQKTFNEALDGLECQYFYNLKAAEAAADKSGDAQGTVPGRVYDDAVAEERDHLAAAEKAQEDRLELIEGVSADHSREADEVRQQRGVLMKDSIHNPKNNPPD